MDFHDYIESCVCDKAYMICCCQLESVCCSSETHTGGLRRRRSGSVLRGCELLGISIV